MDITSASAGYCAQKIAGNDRIRIRTADSSGRLGGDPAGSVGTETAADALQAETTFGRLAVYTVMEVSMGSSRIKASRGLSALAQVLLPKQLEQVEHELM